MIRRKPKRKDPVRRISDVLKKSAVSFLAGTLVLTSLTFMDGDPVEAQAASADNMTIIFQRDGKNTVTHNGQAEGTFTYNGIDGSGVSYGTLNLDNANYYGNTDMHVNIGQTINLYAPSADTDYTGKIGYRGGYQFAAAGGKGGNLTNAQDNQTALRGSSYGGYGTAVVSGTYDYNTGTSITYRKGSNGASYDGLRNWNYWYPYSEEKDITSDNLQYNNAKFYAHTGYEYRSYMLTAQYGSASYIQVSGNNYIVAGGGGAGTVAFHQRSDGSKWVTAQDGQHADRTPNVPSGKAYFNPTSSGMTLHYSDYASPNVNAGRIVGTGVRQGVQATNGQWYKTDIVTGWLADSGTYNNPVIFEKTYPGYSGYGTKNGNVITPSDNAYNGLAAINKSYTGNPYVQLKCNYKIVVINNPTRPGFNFTGWTNLKNCQLLANSNGQSTFKVTGTDSSIEATWSSNSYTLTINPNGGIYNGTTANTVKTLPAETNYEVTEIPTRTGYDFVGWKRSGSGSLHSGTAEAVNSMIKVTENADSDGTAYTNYSMNVTNNGGDTWWPGFTAFHYPYTAGHTYIMSYDVRVNNSSGLVYSQIRNSGFDNNYDFNYATGNLNDVTNGWEHRTIERTFQSTTSQNGSAVTTNPVVEFYCGVAVGKTGKFSFDLKNITIYDATAKKYVTSKSATVKSGSTVTMGGGNTTLTAVWKAKEYKLTLNPNSGKFEDGTTKAKTLSPNLFYGGGNWWDISSMPVSRTGYTLEGWYDKASGGEKVYTADGTYVNGTYWQDQRYLYEGDLTVYAHWISDNDTISYDAKGGRNPKAGLNGEYTFSVSSGKYLTDTAGKSGGNAAYESKSESSVWILEKSSYNSNGYYIINKETGNALYADAKTCEVKTGPQVQKNNSYLWNVYVSGNKCELINIGSSYTISYQTGDTKAYCDQDPYDYDDSLYQIDFTMDGSKTDYPNRLKTTTNTVYVNEIVPVKKGYIFFGWNTEADGSGKTYDPGTLYNVMPSGVAVTLTAQWTPITYTVKYDGNGATSGSTASSSHTYDVAKELTANGYKKTGYTFSGWNTKADGSGTKYADKASVKNLTSTNGATVTLYAQWTANDGTIYTVNHYTQDLGASTYSLNSTESRTGITGATVNISGLKKTIEGFTYSKAQVNGKDVTSTTVLADGSRVINLYYTRNSYNVVLNKGTGISSVSGAGAYEYGASVTINAALSKGYKWSKWTGTHNTSTEKYTFKMPADNVTDKANATPIVYMVKYDGNNATEGSMASSRHTYNVEQSLTANEYTKAGYTFEGWNTKADGTGTSYTDQQKVKNLSSKDGATIILYAQWTPDDGTIYTVHHYLKDLGSATYTLHETEEKNGTTDATIILADERKDYTGFTYEKGQVDGADVTETTILPDGSRVIDLYYNRNTYNLTLDKGEGIDSVSGAGNYEYGTTVTIDAIVSEDYTWNSWTGTNNTEQKNYTFTMPAEDVQETANATRNKPIDYSISYDLNGGTLEHENPSIYNVETPSFTLNNPTKTGYEFTGWTGSNGVTPQVTVTVSQGTTGDLNYKANWMPITYVIHFDGNGATSGETPDVTGTYDEEFTFPENGFVKETERGDSTFIGWSTDPDSTDPEYKPGDLEKNLTDIKDNVINIFAIWDDCPDIEAEDLFFTLVEAQNGSIDEDKLLSYARAFDKEDGEIAAGEDAEKGTSFTVMNYMEEDFTGFEHEGSVTETYQVIDSVGNQYQKQITVYVVDTAAKEIKPVGTTRFINEKYFGKSAEQGGLANDSIWRTDPDYNNTLKQALENLKNDTPVKSYSFTHEQILEMKEFIETNGIGNSQNPDALSRFYEQFMR